MTDMQQPRADDDEATLGGSQTGDSQTGDSHPLAHADIDQTPLSKKELRAWYSYPFAAEGFGAAGGVFIPIILQGMAANSAFERADPTKHCNTAVAGYDCLVRVLNLRITPTSFVLYSTTTSTLLQLLLYLSIGSLADHGALRKRLLVLFALLGSITSLLFLTAVRDAYYLYAASIYIVSTVFFGATFVFHNAFLPVLVRHHPRDAPEDSTEDAVTNKLSSRATIAGGVGAAVVMLLCAVPAVFIHSPKHFPETYPFQVGVAFAGLWWLLLTIPTALHLRSRPGPPLPDHPTTGRKPNAILFSWRQCARTLRRAPRLSNLFRLLCGWFVYSESFSTLNSVAILFAQSQLGMSNASLALLGVEVLLATAVGAWGWNAMQRRMGWSSRTVLLAQACLFALIPAYALLGLINRSPLGLKHAWEVFMLGAVHGTLMGGAASTCRALFAEMIPRGLEAEMFAFQGITDKGTTWIGPLIVGFIGDATHNQRYMFVFLVGVMVIAVWVFAGVDFEKGRTQAVTFAEEEEATRAAKGVKEMDVEEKAGQWAMVVYQAPAI
ncbi:Autophagy protein 22 [Irineochytrium annulatum]|nr:Autophagy protein 22 [Irineochytrium annulatum]